MEVNGTATRGIVQGPNVALVDMHWFYIRRINYIKYVSIELYSGSELKRQETWFVQTPRAQKHWGRFAFKTIDHCERYNGIEWDHPGEPLDVVRAQVSQTLAGVHHVFIHGHMKMRVFDRVFRISKQYPEIQFRPITLYNQRPPVIVPAETMQKLRRAHLAEQAEAPAQPPAPPTSDDDVIFDLEEELERELNAMLS